MNDILYLVSLYIYLRLYLNKHVYLKQYFQYDSIFVKKRKQSNKKNNY